MTTGIPEYSVEKIEEMKREAANDAILRVLNTWKSADGDGTALVRFLNTVSAHAHNLVDQLHKSATSEPKSSA